MSKLFFKTCNIDNSKYNLVTCKSAPTWKEEQITAAVTHSAPRWLNSALSQYLVQQRWITQINNIIYLIEMIQIHVHFQFHYLVSHKQTEMVC